MSDSAVLLEDLSQTLMEAAWHHVADNDGCAGVDGVTVERYLSQAAAGLPELRKQLLEGVYDPLPLRKIVIEKKPASRHYRTLLVPTVRDRIAQTAVSRMLTREWEQDFLSSSFAYRPGRGVDLAIEQILAFRDQGYGWVLEADIVHYFDNISHHLLERRLKDDTSPPIADLLRKWIDAEVWDGRHLYRLNKGIPQGAPVSPLLANLALNGFDRTLESGDGRLIRYADDFIVLAKTKAAATEALTRTRAWMQSAGLELHPDKTSVTSFADGFQYLGVTFRGSDVTVPWKRKGRVGHMVFLARRMPQKDLKEYRKRRASSEGNAPPPAFLQRQSPEPRATSGDQMPFLYVTQPGAVIRKAGERFLVEADQHILLDCPCHEVESVLLFGNVQITTQALTEALDHAIPVSFLTRYGRYRGKLNGVWGRNVDLRLAQYRIFEDSAAGLRLARGIVEQKIRNGIAVLAHYDGRDGAGASTVAERTTMEEQTAALTAAASLAQLDGHEGASASAYFNGLMKYNKSAFVWQGRVRHPATDPLNALLSLAYTLVMGELLAGIEALGLDPSLGVLHELEPNRPSLALDLMEAFRHPLADRLVLTLVNRHQFGPDDFDSVGESEGLHLKHPALQRFLGSYEEWMLAPVSADGTPAFRTLLQQEVHHFCDGLRGKAAWTPFAWPWKPEVKCPS